mgnify:CR=1 FL=1
MTVLNNPNVIHRLASGDKQITLIGTAHVSKESVVLVKSVIEEEKPETVAVELCPSRFQTIKQKDQWQEMDIIKVIKDKKAFLLLANFMLASFQKRIAAKLDIKPGAEMIQAIESGEDAGAKIHLADRDIRVTLSRTWRTMGLWAKIKLLFQLILSLGEVEDINEEDIENMKNQDVLESLLAELGQTMPVVKDILIDERDQYLCEKIRSAPGDRIVAVVGAGHVPGIKKYWEKEIQLDELSRAGLETGQQPDDLPPHIRTVTKPLTGVIPQDHFRHGCTRVTQRLAADHSQPGVPHHPHELPQGLHGALG